MSRFQVLVVGICLLLVMIDGFDIAVMSLTSPHVRDDWGISKSLIGYLLSASLLGMAIGSFTLSPLADRFGRRRLLLTGVTIAFVGTTLSVFVQNATQLLACRLITGFGIGCMIAVIGVMLNEFSSKKRYGFIMGFYAAGINIGGMVGGAAAAPLIADHGWRAAFVLAAAATGVVMVAAYLFLPESVDYLVDKGDLNGLNKVLGKMKHAPLQELPTRVAKEEARGSIKEVFGPQMLARTALMMAGYAFLVISLYFLANWNPTLLSDASGNKDMGATATVLWNFGGMAGCLAFGIAASWVQSRFLNVLCLAGAAISAFVYGIGIGHPGLAIAMILIAGFMCNAGVAGFYSIIPPLFPSHVRATGYGMIIGLGRLAAVVSPILGGMLLDRGWSPSSAIVLFSVPLALAAVACFILDRIVKRDSDAEATPASQKVAEMSS
ncbi:MFS transporter [Rhodococcus hoagii]|nr:MFS transporter [Prescottella equi]